MPKRECSTYIADSSDVSDSTMYVKALKGASKAEGSVGKKGELVTVFGSQKYYAVSLNCAVTSVLYL
jgi:hypothetical protein